MAYPTVWRSHLTPVSLLRRSAAVFRDRTAVVHGPTRLTYAQFEARVNRLASALRSTGIRHGDRVAFLAPNVPPLLEAHFGVPILGAVLVAINTRLSPEDIAYILDDSRSKLLFVDSELAALIASIVPNLRTLERVITVRDVPGPCALDGVDYEEFIAQGAPDPIDLQLGDEDDLIAIDYTSGTTGNSKGVMYTHRATYLNAIGQVAGMQLDSNSVYLWTLPMFHCNGWCFPWAVVAAGATNVCLRRVDAGAVWELIQGEQVSHLCGAPTVLISLVNHPSANQVKLSRPVRIATGGAPPSPTLIEQLGAIGIDLTHIYGLTETYGPFTLCEWQSQWDELDLAGRAHLKARQGVPNVLGGEVRVVDGEMRDVPADGQTMGEVVMRGNTVMLGYYNQPEATAEAFRGGWFHSGDLGVMYPDGYIELRDRKKDIIISGGENISTIEVERAIAQHPAVMEVAVIAVPDAKWGEVPKAFVSPKSGCTVSEHEIIGFCRERLAHFKCPKAVDFTDLPKTSTGKIQKYVLREREWAGRDRRIQ